MISIKLFLSAYISVECCKSSLLVGKDPKLKNTESEDTKNIPTDEGELKVEEAPLVAVHQLFGARESFFYRNIGVFSNNERNDAVAVNRDVTGNDEQ